MSEFLSNILNWLKGLCLDFFEFVVDSFYKIIKDKIQEMRLVLN